MNKTLKNSFSIFYFAKIISINITVHGLKLSVKQSKASRGLKSIFISLSQANHKKSYYTSLLANAAF